MLGGAAAFGAAWVVVCAQVALGQTETTGDFLNLSFTGDGRTPSSLELHGRATRGAVAASFAATASSTGDATWSLPLALPTARLMPAVSVSYSSSGGYGWVGRGFAVQAGLDVRAPTGPAAAGYVDVPGALIVSGGLDGLLVPDGDAWRWVSDTPGAVVAAYDPVARRFTVRSGLVTWTLDPRDDVDWDALGAEPWHWHATSQADTTGDRVDYLWSGERLDRVEYGGVGPSGVAPPGDEHFLAVTFTYSATAHAFVRADQGVVETVDQRLRSVEIRSAWDRAESPLLRYDLTYDGADDAVQWIDVTEVRGDGTDGGTQRVASFDYTTLDDGFEIEADAPPFLSSSGTITNGVGQGDTTLDLALLDVSGDTLPDAVESTLAAAWQRVDHLADGVTSHWWEDLFADEDPHTLEGLSGPLEDSSTVIVWDDGVTDPQPEDRIQATYGLRRTVDVDGDGLL
ncbi:MAG: hypothetical protein ABMB14_22840, partial [Myxococcota bacterium]